MEAVVKSVDPDATVCLGHGNWNYRLCCQDVRWTCYICDTISDEWTIAFRPWTFIWLRRNLQLAQMKGPSWSMILKLPVDYMSLKGIRRKSPPAASPLMDEDWLQYLQRSRLFSCGRLAPALSTSSILAHHHVKDTLDPSHSKLWISMSVQKVNRHAAIQPPFLDLSIQLTLYTFSGNSNIWHSRSRSRRVVHRPQRES